MAAPLTRHFRRARPHQPKQHLIGPQPEQPSILLGEPSVNQYYWLRDWADVLAGPQPRVRACASVNEFALNMFVSILAFVQIYWTRN